MVSLWLDSLLGLARPEVVMAMNRVQFQQGMSLQEFMRDFGTEAQCAQALERAR